MKEMKLVTLKVESLSDDMLNISSSNMFPSSSSQVMEGGGVLLAVQERVTGSCSTTMVWFRGLTVKKGETERREKMDGRERKEEMEGERGGKEMEGGRERREREEGGKRGGREKRREEME